MTPDRISHWSKAALAAATALGALLALSLAAWAITVIAEPSPARRAGQTTLTSLSSFAVANPGCTMEINYGDGSGWSTLGVCNTNPCTQKATHTYNTMGTFLVQVRSTGPCNFPPNGPDPAQRSLRVCNRLSWVTAQRLPAPTLGVPYRQQLQTHNDSQVLNFRVTGGRLPPGLSLETATGLISGTPTALGNYWARIEVNDSCSSPVSRRFVFGAVETPPITVTVRPDPVMARGGAPAAQTLTYSFSTPATAPFTLVSTGGALSAGGATVGSTNTTVSAAISGGRGTATEALRIERAWLQRALARRTTALTYSRRFLLSTATAQGGPVAATANVRVRIVSPAQAPLTVTWMRLRFENGRPQTTVAQNEPGLRLWADLNYVGSGLLRGYWEVDGRVLAHFSQNLVYSGRTITLASPAQPALPTFETGSHRARLVITEPAQEFEPPVALYFVEARPSAEQQAVELLRPDDGATLDPARAGFAWRGSPEMASYQLEIWAPGGDEPLLEAQTRAQAYTAPPALLGLRLKAGEAYEWRVRGYDERGQPVGLSRAGKFTLGDG